MDKQTLPCDSDVWKRIKSDYHATKVFINIPYVKGYQKLRVTLIATVLAVGLRPILASERSTGTLRLCKLCELMQTSKYAITDLSYDGLLNMPFELGFLLALGRHGNTVLVDNKYIDKAKKLRKFESRLSNLKGLDILHHGRRPEQLCRELLKRMRNDMPEVKSYIPDRLDPLVKKIRSLERKVAAADKRGALTEFIETLLEGLRKRAKEPQQ